MTIDNSKYNEFMVKQSISILKIPVFIHVLQLEYDYQMLSLVSQKNIIKIYHQKIQF